MTRIIKFRGKSADGKWHYGDLLQYNDGTISIGVHGTYIDDGYSINDGYNFIIDVEEDSVGQFTGLTDKNGTEIYEGDIITLDTWKGKHVVMFVDGAFCFKEIGVDTSYCNDIHYTHHAGRKQALVIGNIHDKKKGRRMKTITFRIPTSFAELRQIRKEYLNQRYRNNVQVIRDVIDGIIGIANNGYWRNDISETFKNRVLHTAPYSEEIYKIYKNAKDKLK